MRNLRTYTTLCHMILRCPKTAFVAPSAQNFTVRSFSLRCIRKPRQKHIIASLRRPNSDSREDNKISDNISISVGEEHCSDHSSMLFPAEISPNSQTPMAKLLQWDKDISYAIYRYYEIHVQSRLPLLLLEVSGHGVPWLLVPVLVFFLKTDLSPTGSALMLNFLSLTILDLAVIGVLKPVFHRKRPVYNTGIGHVTIHVVDQFSFPSGHSTRAGFLLSFVWFVQTHHAIGLLPLIDTHGFALATLVWAISVCVSRVALGRHHVLDVAAGVIIGATYVFLWDPFWISGEFADSLREGLRGTLLGAAHTISSQNGSQLQL